MNPIEVNYNIEGLTVSHITKKEVNCQLEKKLTTWKETVSKGDTQSVSKHINIVRTSGNTLGKNYEGGDVYAPRNVIVFNNVQENDTNTGTNFLLNCKNINNLSLNFPNSSVNFNENSSLNEPSSVPNSLNNTTNNTINSSNNLQYPSTSKNLYLSAYQSPKTRLNTAEQILTSEKSFFEGVDFSLKEKNDNIEFDCEMDMNLPDHKPYLDKDERSSKLEYGSSQSGSKLIEQSMKLLHRKKGTVSEINFHGVKPEVLKHENVNPKSIIDRYKIDGTEFLKTYNLTGNKSLSMSQLDNSKLKLDDKINSTGVLEDVTPAASTISLDLKVGFSDLSTSFKRYELGKKRFERNDGSFVERDEDCGILSPPLQFTDREDRDRFGLNIQDLRESEGQLIFIF